MENAVFTVFNNLLTVFNFYKYYLKHLPQTNAFAKAIIVFASVQPLSKNSGIVLKCRKNVLNGGNFVLNENFN